jgi:hypothetical protein
LGVVIVWPETFECLATDDGIRAKGH